MIRNILAAALAAACIGTPALAQAQAGNITSTNGEPILSVGLFNRRPDGTVSGSASSTGSAVGEDLSGILSMSPCDSLSASSSTRVPAPATDAWRLSGHVTVFSEASASFQLTWQRIRENGTDVQGAAQSRTFTLPLSGRETLDSISAPAAGTCPERRITLDVAFGRSPVAVRLRGGGVTSVRVGAAAGAGSGGRVMNTPPAVPVGGVATVSGATETGGGGGTSSPASGGATPLNAAGRRRFQTVDLWMVHETPGQADRSEHRQAEATPFPRATTFSPATITTSAGVFTVVVECYVEDGRTPAGEPRLFVSASRKVTFAPSSGQVRDVRPVVEGSIKTAVEKPGPNDVLAFELPAIQYPGAPSVPDKFSIRLTSVP